ncbi:MAG: sodium/glutamate symporter [Pseudomonadota bacterium]
MDILALEIPAFESTTIGFLVFLVGATATRKSRFLREFSIPEPVSGGLLACVATLALFLLFDIEVSFDLAARDFFLILFFSAIGLNARLSDLREGGVPFLILLGLTVATILLQNGIGMSLAAIFGEPAKLGVLLGSASLIGGHGTAIAWSPEVVAVTAASGAQELGVSVATLGLVAAALVGGPIAKLLVERHDLKPRRPDEPTTLGLSFKEEKTAPVAATDLMHTLLWLNITIMAGFLLGEGIASLGLKLPDFVPCLLMGIVIGNSLPRLLPRVPPLSRTPAMSLISDFALGTFLAMSLMSMQLWALAGLFDLIAVTIMVQMMATIAFVLLILFRVMGRDYRAAVLASGFAGFALGATPTAIANMNAVTKNYGPSPIAFVILPLVSAFFVDLANAAVIQTILGL